MPCWSIREAEVSVKKMNHELLVAALTELKFNPSVAVNGKIQFSQGEYDNGTLRLRMSDESAQRMANKINRAYSEQAVKKMATKYKWQGVSTSVNAQGQNVFVYER